MANFNYLSLKFSYNRNTLKTHKMVFSKFINFIEVYYLTECLVRKLKETFFF